MNMEYISVKTTLEPLLRAARLVGLAPFRLSGTPSDNLRTSRVWYLYSSILLVVILSGGSCNLWQSFVYFLGKPTLTDSISNFLLVCTNYIASVLSLGLVFFLPQNGIPSVVPLLTYVDRILIPEGNPRNNVVRQWSCVCLLGFGTWIGAMCAYDLYFTPYFCYICLYLAQFIVLIWICQFVTCVLLLRNGFRTINEKLPQIYGLHNRNLLAATPERDVLQDDFEKASPNLQRVTCEEMSAVSRAYGALCEAGDQLSDYFGVAMLAHLANILVTEVGWVFNVLRYAVARTPIFSTSYIAVAGNSIALHACYLAAVALTAHGAVAEAARTGRTVHRLLVHLQMQNPQTGAVGQLRQLSQQLLHERLQLSAAGLLPLNRALLLGAAACLVTHMLILLQFVA